MITYKVDTHNQEKSNSRIRDLTSFLNDVSPTMHRLQKNLIEHEATLSSGPLNRYRAQLLDMVTEAIDLTSSIAEKTHRLVTVSEQTAKHLAALDDHFETVLASKSAVPAQVAVQQLS